MSDYLEALRAQYEADLRCPRCGAENIKAFVSVHLVTTSRVDCDACGYSAVLERFLRKDKP